MSGEILILRVAITTLGSDHLSKKDGEPMYPGDVVEELHAVLKEAVFSWYERRGKDLLACEPDV